MRTQTSHSKSEAAANAALAMVTALITAAVLCLCALVAGCGGSEQPTCPPANGAALGSAETVACGCYADVASAASSGQIEAAVRTQMRGSGRDSCLFTPGGATTALGADLQVRIGRAPGHARPSIDEDGDLPGSGRARVHFAVTPPEP